MLIVFSGNTSWGMYNFRAGLMKSFIEFGYEVCVVAPEDDYSAKIKAEGIKFYPVKNLKRYSTNPVHDFNLCREYINIYRKLQPAFIFHYTIKPNIYGTLAARFCKIQSISITTGLGNAFSKKNHLFYIAKYLYKLSSAFAAEVWFLNSNDRQIFLANDVIPKRKSFILPGEGVKTSEFPAATHAAGNENTSFLLVSRMLYPKGIAIFADASRELIKKGYAINSLLLGEIDKENSNAVTLETIMEWQREGILRYLGSSGDVKPYIENVHAVVLPSYYKEGIPRVLLEAACMAKPIITTDNPGCVEVVEDGVNGFLCEIKNVGDLVKKMEKFIHLPAEEKRRMGLAGRKKILANFDEKIIVEIYKNKLEQYIKPMVNKTTRYYPAATSDQL